MALYDDYLNSILKNLDVAYQQKSQQLRGQLAGRPKQSVDYYMSELNKSYMDKLGELIPQLRLQQEKDLYGRGMAEKEFGLRKQQATIGASQEEQRMMESRRQAELQRALQEREIALQEAQLQAQQEALGAQQRDWWKPLLGQLAGTAIGIPLGGWTSKLMGLKGYSDLLNMGGNQPLDAWRTSGYDPLRQRSDYEYNY